MMDYDYTDRDLLATRENYFYTKLHGPDYLNAYRAARRDRLAALPDGPVPARRAGPLPAGDAPIDTAALLDALEGAPDVGWTDRLVQRFEVTKRLYSTYDASLRKGLGPINDLMLYARLARLLAADTSQLDWLNALLKLHDLLLSQPPAHLGGVAGLLHDTVAAEMNAVARLETRNA